MIEQIKQLIAEGENQKVEFKKAKNDFPNDAFGTICAFLNSDGGTLILGVDDSGTILGVNPSSVDAIKTKFVTSMNNSEIINPIIYLSINELEIENKTILYVTVPNASNVYRYKSRIYKRNHESDLDVTNIREEVAKLYLLTDNSYSENQIFPYLPVEELREDLIAKVKKIAKINNANNDWINLDTKEFLRRNKLYRRDYTHNKEGVTLAAVLLFGTDEQIASVAPSFKFELAKCVDNPERYDDRITLQTNLIECLEKASEFIEKHLPSPFYLEGTQRIDLRNNIFREIIANMLVHKEYLGAEPTKLIIFGNKIIAQNSNRPHIKGLITLENTTNFSKNPNIVKIFRAMGYVEDFGTGIPKLFKYCKEYSGYEPIIEDENIFKFELKHDFFKTNITEKSDKVSEKSDKVSEKSDKVSEKSDKVSEKSDKVSHKKLSVNQQKVIIFCNEPKSALEIMDYLNLKSRNNLLNKILKPLIMQNLIARTVEDKKHSSKQKYMTINKVSSDD